MKIVRKIQKYLKISDESITVSQTVKVKSKSENLKNVI